MRLCSLVVGGKLKLVEEVLVYIFSRDVNRNKHRLRRHECQKGRRPGVLPTKTRSKTRHGRWEPPPH